MIKISNLTKKFDELVIFDNINVIFPSKGLCFVSSPSGSGKTTLLNLLSLIDKDYSGDIFINDINYKSIINSEEFRGNNFSYIFQENDLFNNLSIKDNLCIDKDIDIKDILKKVRLNVDENRLVNTLSLGEYKRVSLARAIINESKVIFIDELTASLDFENKKIIMDIIKEISKCALIIYVSHDTELIHTYADFIYKI